jgi:arylsulfatase
MTSEMPGPKESYMNVGPGWAWAHNTPFRRYKSWVHEGGIATPFIVRWPGVVKPGTLTPQVGHVIDLLPTCLELAGAKYPHEFNGNSVLPAEGRSLTPIFRGKKRPPPEMLFWEEQGSKAVRHGKWKLAWDVKVGRWELYDLEADRTEMHDLAKSKSEKVKELALSYARWEQTTGRTATAPGQSKAKPGNQSLPR